MLSIGHRLRSLIDLFLMVLSKTQHTFRSKQLGELMLLILSPALLDELLEPHTINEQNSDEFVQIPHTLELQSENQKSKENNMMPFILELYRSAVPRE